MDDWDSIGAVYIDFSRPGSNHIGLILFLQCLSVSVILIIGKDTSKDCIKF